MKCNDCAYFINIEWIGTRAKVKCHHPFYTPNENTDPEQGCPFGNRKPKDSEATLEADIDQQKLF